MVKTKLFITIFIFSIFLIFTSLIKNETRILEKKIINLNSEILSKKKDINETQLDFYYLTSPAEVEKKLNIISFENYKPISYSKIYFDILDFTKIQNKISTLQIINEKKTNTK